MKLYLEHGETLPDGVEFLVGALSSMLEIWR